MCVEEILKKNYKIPILGAKMVLSLNLAYEGDVYREFSGDQDFKDFSSVIFLGS